MNKNKDHIENQFDPMCLKNEVHVAITNQGELIPCCYLDTPQNNLDSKYKKLLKVSKINDYDNIEEIYLTKEWIEFAENLRNHKGFNVCQNVCPKNRKTDVNNIVRKEKVYYKGEVVDEKNY
jgi:hypothetical protein